MSHQAQGNNTVLAPTMRKSAMSSGSKVCAAEARAMTMKEVQIRTVTTAAARPTVRAEKCMRRC